MSTPKYSLEQRAALLASKPYMSAWRNGVLHRVVAVQRFLTSYLAYGYDNAYLESALKELQSAVNLTKEIQNEDSQVQSS